MGLWKKLTGYRLKTRADSIKNKPLPRVTEEYFHRNFADAVSPTPGNGGKKYDEFIPAWNNGDYETAFNLLSEAIELGLEYPDKSSAHSYLGQMYIKQCRLDKAISEFLMSLKTRVRPPDITWETAMRLYYIYSEAGESELAKKLLSLAEDSNSRLQVPRKHVANVETEIRELTRQQSADRICKNSEGVMEYNDFVANLALAIKSMTSGEAGADKKLQQAISSKVRCMFCKTVVDPVNSFRKSDALFVCPNCNELWIKF